MFAFGDLDDHLCYVSRCERRRKTVNGRNSIRDERPIAGIIYATDAVRWHGRRNGHDAAEIARRLGEVRAWFERNRLDLGWVIRNIHRRMA